jgi:hypothetical protein
MHAAAKRAEAGTSTLVQGRSGRRPGINPTEMELTMQYNIIAGAFPPLARNDNRQAVPTITLPPNSSARERRRAIVAHLKYLHANDVPSEEVSRAIHRDNPGVPLHEVEDAARQSLCLALLGPCLKGLLTPSRHTIVRIAALVAMGFELAVLLGWF